MSRFFVPHIRGFGATCYFDCMEPDILLFCFHLKPLRVRVSPFSTVTSRYDLNLSK